MTKLRTLVLFAALLTLATAFVACGGSGDQSPQALLDDATFEGVDSGNLDLSIAIDAKGSKGGQVDASLSGPFQKEEGEDVPQLDLTAKADGRMDGKDIDFDASLVLVPNKAYVGYDGVEYEVDPTTFSFVKSSIEEAQQREGGGEQSSSIAACQEAAGELNVGDFAENLVEGGSADVGGTSTTKVSGDLNVAGAIDALVGLSEEPACKAQLSAVGPLPSADEVDEAESEVESALERAHVEVFVGDDDIVRRIAAQLEIEPKRSGSGPKSVDLEFDLKLTGVNEEQSIVVPTKTRPLSELFLKLRINPIELIGLLSGEGEGGGIAGLLDEVGGGFGGIGSSGDSGGSQSYTECLQEARSAADIQKCGSKLE